MKGNLLLRKLKSDLNIAGIMGTLHDDQCIFMISR